MGLIGKFSTVGLATLASRVLGFFREAMIAAVLGAGPVADAFYAAFRFPNLFRRLFAEGAFNSAFVPLFAKELEGGGRQAARAFRRTGPVGPAVPPDRAVRARDDLHAVPRRHRHRGELRPGARPSSPRRSLLAAIMFPYLAAMSLVAMLSGILNSFRRYFLAAPRAGPAQRRPDRARWRAGLLGQTSPPQIGLSVMVGRAVGGLAAIRPALYRRAPRGLRLALQLPRLTPAVRRLLVLALPAAITGGITQINLLIGQNIASSQDGAIADHQLCRPHLPVAARRRRHRHRRRAAAGTVAIAQGGRLHRRGHLQNRSLEFGLGLTLPAAVGFVHPARISRRARL